MIPQPLLDAIKEALGGSLNFNIAATNREECESELKRIATIKNKLGGLRIAIVEGQTKIRGKFNEAKASVSSTAGSILLAGFLGRGVNGAFNAAQRANIDNEKAATIAQWEDAKRTVDSLLEQLENARATILSHPLYASAEPRPPIAGTNEPNSRFHVLHGDKVAGPFSQSQLLAKWFAGEIKDSTKCCLEGAQDWVPYSDLIKQHR
jgi:GYF domain 2